MDRLERKNWVDVLLQIAGGGALIVGGAIAGGIYVAGKEALKYFAKEKYMETFLSEEDNLRRKIRELDRPISNKENMLASGEAIEDWRGNDARPQLQAELDRMKEQRDALAARLEEVEAARRQLEDVPVDPDDEGKSLAHAPGAHSIYR